MPKAKTSRLETVKIVLSEEFLGEPGRGEYVLALLRELLKVRPSFTVRGSADTGFTLNIRTDPAHRPDIDAAIDAVTHLKYPKHPRRSKS